MDGRHIAPLSLLEDPTMKLDDKRHVWRISMHSDVDFRKRVIYALHRIMHQNGSRFDKEAVLKAGAVLEKEAFTMIVLNSKEFEGRTQDDEEVKSAIAEKVLQEEAQRRDENTPFSRMSYLSRNVLVPKHGHPTIAHYESTCLANGVPLFRMGHFTTPMQEGGIDVEEPHAQSSLLDVFTSSEIEAMERRHRETMGFD
jgi:hypothetical protein